MNMRLVPPAARAFAGAATIFTVLALPKSRAALESAMVLHMGGQLPLLALAGVLLAAGLRPVEPLWLRKADWLGLCGLTLALFAVACWMLPRSLDGAIADAHVEVAKFVSLPLLLGLPLGLSWYRLPVLGRIFVIANFISMLGAVGGIYLLAPTRLCAFYLLDQQSVTGKTLIAAAAILTLATFFAALFGWTPRLRVKAAS